MALLQALGVSDSCKYSHVQEPDKLYSKVAKNDTFVFKFHFATPAIDNN